MFIVESVTDDYEARRTQHAPKTIEESRQAAKQLLAEGFSEYVVADALSLNIEQVRRLIANRCENCEE